MAAKVPKSKPWWHDVADSFTVDDNGALHSFNDQPALIKTNGDKCYFSHGMLHRDDMCQKPAYEPADPTLRRPMFFDKGYWVDQNTPRK